MTEKKNLVQIQHTSGLNWLNTLHYKKLSTTKKDWKNTDNSYRIYKHNEAIYFFSTS